jgi:hypothetical protein
VLGQRRAEHVLHEVLAAAAIERADAHVGVQVEAVLVRLTGARGRLPRPTRVGYRVGA